MRIKIVPIKPDAPMPESYYEMLAETMGEEAAAWSRLPREEREKELRWYHDHLWRTRRQIPRFAINHPRVSLSARLDRKTFLRKPVKPVQFAAYRA